VTARAATGPPDEAGWTGGLSAGVLQAIARAAASGGESRQSALQAQVIELHPTPYGGVGELMPLLFPLRGKAHPSQIGRERGVGVDPGSPAAAASSGTPTTAGAGRLAGRRLPVARQSGARAKELESPCRHHGRIEGLTQRRAGAALRGLA